jgi:hypothetical protein
MCEVLTVGTVKSIILWDLMSCTPIEVQYFGGMYCPYLWGQRVRQTRNQDKKGRKLHFLHFSEISLNPYWTTRGHAVA